MYTSGPTQVVRFECTTLNGTGKTGRLKCDPDGYYDVILGGFNVRNTRQDLWPWDTSEQFFQPNSVLRRRVAAGQLYGEWGHPMKQPGQTNEEFLQRVLNVYEDNVSHHIKEYHYEESTLVEGADGKPAIVFYGRVKPFGPRADMVAQSLENPAQNSAFSIRTLTRDQKDYMGRAIKRIVAMVTWDGVLSPGIDFATKYNAPSLESDVVDLCTVDEVERVYRDLRKNNTGMESGYLEDRLRDLIVELKQTQVDHKTGLILPASAKW